MREDDRFRHVVPLLRRTIILVAVIIAVPVILWTITEFRSDLCGSAARPDIPSARRDRHHERARSQHNPAGHWAIDAGRRWAGHGRRGARHRQRRCHAGRPTGRNRRPARRQQAMRRGPFRPRRSPLRAAASPVRFRRRKPVATRAAPHAPPRRLCRIQSRCRGAARAISRRARRTMRTYQCRGGAPKPRVRLLRRIQLRATAHSVSFKTCFTE